MNVSSTLALSSLDQICCPNPLVGQRYPRIEPYGMLVIRRSNVPCLRKSPSSVASGDLKQSRQSFGSWSALTPIQSPHHASVVPSLKGKLRGTYVPEHPHEVTVEGIVVLQLPLSLGHEPSPMFFQLVAFLADVPDPSRE